ncbi:MAG TPA: FecR domain-containing protein [Candidatus Angelobacter sp.]
MGYQENPKQKLEQAVAALRQEQPDAGSMKAAEDRVWQQLAAEMQTGRNPQLDSIRGCDDVKALLQLHQAGTLSPARALLMQDHLHECPACRREAEKAKRGAGLAPWKQELPKARPQHFRWMMAAAAVIVLAVGAYVIQDRMAVPGGSRARVEEVNGTLYLVSLAGEKPLPVGEEINEGQSVRTPSGSRAMLRLRDGSLVEMNERAQFSVGIRRQDTTIHLERGNIIVEAAKRRTGHLYVADRDCLVSVTGTVFSVNSGIKGSRVSVIEGEVRVAESGDVHILHPGDQLSTNASVGAVPLQQEISWSQNADKHLALLAELVHFQNKVQQNVRVPGLRYQSNLLPLLPQSTLLYAGVPNYADAIQQADQLFQQELQESAVLREWWQQAQAHRNGPDPEDVLQKLHELGQYVGDEIVFSVGMTGGHASPLVIAQLQKPGLKEFIAQLMAQRPPKDHGPGLRVLAPQELMSAQGAGREGMLVLVRPDLVAVSPDLSTLQNFNAQLSHGGGGFSNTGFGHRLQQAYAGGAGLLFAADLQEMEKRQASNDVFQQTGFADLKYLIAERKDVAGQTVNRAELTFNGRRHGIASWLAAPAPMGGLDFVSPNAGAVAAGVFKNAGAQFDDLVNIAGAADANFAIDLADAQVKTKIRFKEDLANTLGGELVLALDGPIFPTPSWKVIIEVYDPGRLQQTFEQLIADVNAKVGQTGLLTLDKQEQDGLAYYTLHSTDEHKVAEVDYTFTDGYLVLGPSRAMVMEAVRIHQSGNSLAKSGEFHALLPADHYANVSALLYQNLAPVIGPIVQQLTPSQLQSWQVLAAETKPSVVCAYGEEDAIRVASNSRLFGLDLNTLALSSLLKLSHLPQKQMNGLQPMRN